MERGKPSIKVKKKERSPEDHLNDPLDNCESLKDCECEKLMRDLSISELNDADRLIVRMLHRKCSVIARARAEMNHLDDKFNYHIEQLKRLISDYSSKVIRLFQYYSYTI